MCMLTGVGEAGITAADDVHVINKPANQISHTCNVISATVSSHYIQCCFWPANTIWVLWLIH